jgi:Domain of unknown function (DUF5666)
MNSPRIIVAWPAAALALSAVPVAQASLDDRAGEYASRDDSRAAAARQFEGRVTSVNRERQTFRLRRESGARVRFKVTARTRFERIAGLSALRRGLAVEVNARRGDGGWVASKVERHSADRGDDSGRDHSDD